MINPDLPCPHANFEAMVGVNRITESDDGPVVGYSADIKAWCRDCDEPFRWIGPPVGVSPAHPAVSIDHTTLRAPLRPASSDPDFGLGLPGFSMRVEDGS